MWRDCDGEKHKLERQRVLALGGGMEFWEISGDLGRPLQVPSLPSLQTTTRQCPLLKLTSSYFYNLHTHAHMRNWNMNVWMLRDIHTSDSHKHKHSQLLHTHVDSADPQFIRHKHSAAIIASDACLLLLFESLWNGTSSAGYFVCDSPLCIHVKLNNCSDTSQCVVDFDYLYSVFRQQKTNFQQHFFPLKNMPM